jgi:hypothetical protein
MSSLKEIVGKIRKLFHMHDWEGVGDVIELYEPTWSVYYAARTRWRKCKKCGKVEVFWKGSRYWDEESLWADWLESRGEYWHLKSEKEKQEWFKWVKEWIDDMLTIPKNAPKHSTFEVTTVMEAPETRRMYGQA